LLSMNDDSILQPMLSQSLVHTHLLVVGCLTGAI